jgi:C-terminal processing protease CtpA/Prc
MAGITVSGDDLRIDPETRDKVIEGFIKGLEERYILAEKAEKMADHIRTRWEAGAYSDLYSASSLSQALQADAWSVYEDRHLVVRYTLEPRQRPDQSTEDSQRRRQERLNGLRANNFGFHRVERLRGNIGYIDLKSFDPPRVAGGTATAAMTFVAHGFALIFDMRNNFGGSPGMIALISSYLFDTPTQLNTFHRRHGETRAHQWWTLPYVPGEKFGREKPVYVLTSRNTFSAAEEFTYNLKNLKRATVIGEKTQGGAHPTDEICLHPHFHAEIPAERAVNPITGTNWEGSGVEPDIEVPEGESFNVAYRLALEYVLALELSEVSSSDREEFMEDVRAAYAELRA